MKSTPYHAKYYAHCLTLKHPSDSVQKFTAALWDARVDLNPHQVEAALFAFQSPLKKGAILADEVGLGKTIEAGLIIAQKWAEKSRRILIICPANLRKQWAMEMQDKFFLPSIIVENDLFKGKSKLSNPFQLQDTIIICSFQFARAKESLLAQAGWDLAVIDEAHRLRNVYRPDNKIGNSIKRSLKDVRKILLTATPLQNSLSELYGLVSLIDDYAFGDYASYKAQYSRLDTESAFSSLKARLAPICKRTLRRQVQEYINYTKRVAIVEEFIPHDAETELYELVSNYLRRDKLYALPNSQRHLMTLILRKLLASSSFAIQGTFEKLADKLEAALKNIPGEDNPIDDFETFNELSEQWETEESIYDTSDIEAIRDEIAELRKYTRLALSIKSNSKGEKLVTALEKGFDKLRELGAPQKAIIFTESRRTQNYIKQILDQAGYEGKVVLFNGTNNDHDSRMIYEHWQAVNKNSDRVSGSKSADMRQALTDYFREEAQIMIATEAAAEGINLQFCSLVVNYDLPWNPQRIEQRIGRCHRYGQKFDVVVLNFLNKTNAADQRVYRLLDEKFQLFNGVFGASDEILGKIEEGVDFEKRIGEIFQRCRSTEEINAAFDELQAEYEEQIDKTFKITRKKLLENFDAEVHEKLRVSLDKTNEYITKQERWLWKMTKQYVGLDGYFHDADLSFRVKNNIYGLPKGNYRLLRHCESKPTPTHEAIRMGELNPAWQPNEHFDGFYHIYRLGHPLAQKIINHYMGEIPETREVVFDQKSDKLKRTALKPYVDKTGYLQLSKLTIQSFETEEYLILSGITQDGIPLEHETCHRLFDLPATVGDKAFIIPETMVDLSLATKVFRQQIVNRNTERNSLFFSEEMDKLQEWAEDMCAGLEREIKDIDAEVRLRKVEAKKMTILEAKIEAQRDIKELEAKRNKKRRNLFDAQDEIEQKKDILLAEIENRLKQSISEEVLFTIKWKLI